MGFSLGGALKGAVGGFLGSGGSPIGALAGGAAGLFSDGDEARLDTRQLSTLAPWQQELAEKYLKPAIGKKPEPDTPYTGQLPGTVPMSEIEKLSLAGLENLFSDAGIFAQQRNTVSELLQDRGQDIDQLFEETVKKPLLEDFQEDILPMISREYAPRGFYSGERLRAEEKALEDLLDSLVSARTGMAYQAEKDALNRALEAVSSVGDVTSSLSSAASLGSLPRALEESRLGSEYSEWLRQQRGEQQDIANLLAAIGLPATENLATVIPGETGLLDTLLPAYIGTETGSKSMEKALDKLGKIFL